MELALRVADEFKRAFGAEPRLFRAPGRVNLIGEHTDYNDGFVMPAAIGFATWVAAAPRPDHRVHVKSLEYSADFEFDLDEAEPKPRGDWSDYVRGVALVLQRECQTLGGANLVVHGNVPIGAGLSSSASFEVATAWALLSVNQIDVDPVLVAKMCQRAENEFVGARCGIMDQFVAANGERDSALLLDCRSLQFELVPLLSDAALVICNTMVKHSIAGGEYNERRAQCEEGVRLLRPALPGIKALRDVTLAELEEHKDKLPEVVYRRCRHVVTENARVLRFADALRNGDEVSIGELMRESHASLREDYEVSCAELDIMVECASTVPGVIGSRMTGGGFGGCTINLVQKEAVPDFQRGVANSYRDRTSIEPEIYVSTASQGAGEVTLSSVQRRPSDPAA